MKKWAPLLWIPMIGLAVRVLIDRLEQIDFGDVKQQLLAFPATTVLIGMAFMPALGPVGAPLVVAAGLSIVTLIVAMIGWQIVRQGRQRSGVAVAPEFLLSEATRFFSEHKGAVLLAALVAGMAAANGSRKP